MPIYFLDYSKTKFQLFYYIYTSIFKFPINDAVQFLLICLILSSILLLFRGNKKKLKILRDSLIFTNLFILQHFFFFFFWCFIEDKKENEGIFLPSLCDTQIIKNDNWRKRFSRK